MEPMPETRAAAHQLDPSGRPDDLLGRLTRLARRGQQAVPDLVGMSITALEEGLTFTLVASARQVAVLDAIQYAVGGPSGGGALRAEVEASDNHDVFDEERWQLSAQATAAHAVRSTLTLPIVRGRDVVGTVDLYGASRRAFVGQHDELARIFGAWAAGAVANADLPFATRDDARAAPGLVRRLVVVEVAVGILAEQLGLGVDAAEARLHEAATRGRVSVVELAREIVRARDEESGGS
jgi:GAF domain-containing protein